MLPQLAFQLRNISDYRNRTSKRIDLQINDAQFGYGQIARNWRFGAFIDSNLSNFIKSFFPMIKEPLSALILYNHYAPRNKHLRRFDATNRCSHKHLVRASVWNRSTIVMFRSLASRVHFTTLCNCNRTICTTIDLHNGKQFPCFAFMFKVTLLKSVILVTSSIQNSQLTVS